MKANNIEEFFGTLLYAKTEAHKSHLETKKYAAHKALNEFYDDIVDMVDALIEAYQGLHGKVEDYKNILETDGPNAVPYLENLRDLVANGREEFFEEPELQSDVDAILSLIDSTLYKLKELTESKVYPSLSKYIAEMLTK